MTLVFDTSVLIDLENRHETTVKLLQRLRKVHTSHPAITVINHVEFLWGLRNKSEKHKLLKSMFINRFSMLQTSHATPNILGSLRQKYEQSGLTLPLADWLVASLTIENNMVLVTKDKDFEKIDELKKIIL